MVADRTARRSAYAAMADHVARYPTDDRTRDAAGLRRADRP